MEDKLVQAERALAGLCPQCGEPKELHLASECSLALIDFMIRLDKHLEDLRKAKSDQWIN